MAKRARDADELTAPLGTGAPWDLPAAPHRQEADASMAMLDNQSFSDMVFELDDGTKISAHRVVLSANVYQFAVMFSTNYKENKTRIVRMPGVGAAAVRGLLDWIYLGESSPRPRITPCARFLTAER
jgi:hypothetical protein